MSILQENCKKKGDPRVPKLVAKNTNPKGPSTHYLGTWDIGNSNFSTGSTGFEYVYDYWVLGPLGQDLAGHIFILWHYTLTSYLQV